MSGISNIKNLDQDENFDQKISKNGPKPHSSQIDEDAHFLAILWVVINH